MNRQHPTPLSEEKISRKIGICSTVLVHILLLVIGMSMSVRKEAPQNQQMEILLDFGDPGTLSPSPLHIQNGGQPLLAESETAPEPEELSETVEEVPTPPEPIENPATETVTETESVETPVETEATSAEGDIEQPPVEEPKKEIIKKALFSSRKQKKDSSTTHNDAPRKDSLEKGKPEGNAPDGSPDGSPSAQLKGRTVLGQLPLPEYHQQVEGKVVVDILVDNYGQVINASISPYGTTVQNDALWTAAKAAALQARFDMVSDSKIAKGTITYYFKLK